MMKKSIPAALLCTAAAVLIPATASACPNECNWSDQGGAQLDVRDQPSAQVDMWAAKTEVDHAKSFLHADGSLSQHDRDCFLGKTLEGGYYDAGSHSIRIDNNAKVSGNVQFESYEASELSYWLYSHEDTWWASGSYKVGDVLSFSQGQFSRTETTAEFFSSVQFVAVYVGGGQVIYSPCDGSGQIKQMSISDLEAQLNVTVSIVSRPCDKGGSGSQPGVTPYQSSSDQSATSSQSPSATAQSDDDDDDDEVCDEGDWDECE